MVSIRVTGISEVISFLNEIANPKQVDRVTLKLAEKTALKAYRFAPEDTGDMENSIRVEQIQGGHQVSCNVPYAIYNEFGTYKMPIGSEENPLSITSTSGKGAYRPFMRPAIYAVLAELESIINSVFFDKIKGTQGVV
jgi:hypothetical protein